MKLSVVAGIDIGSAAIKLTLYDGVQMAYAARLSGWNPREAALDLLRRETAAWGIAVEDLVCIVGTGYGRINFPLAHKTMTEITCHGRGAAYMVPGAATVLDIGGQDAKAMRVDNTGKVTDFVMNDKCAAGTGKFFQVMAGAMNLDMAGLNELELSPGEEACTVNAMCTVFAESEVIGLVNKGKSRQAIFAGLYKSVANRVAAMAASVQLAAPVVFTGGVSQNRHMRRELEEKLGVELIVPSHALYAGSIGAALCAWDYSRSVGIKERASQNTQA
ncbi:MAG TPA: acyl-CoA dehydratase activase [Methylomusa anaerophila]|uniref:R-phenyllactate dehydratase activator n=1 Tax=Methylomusa anaerophila TaxID=1930071 RepID=A0A348ALH9_9FIRM|nr:acyl-CoA dehydratase activase [Methylomusa anaerophila]BBB91927.1 R-phenyllactate dehydratase activator [Methylomusa anaerophila]HML88060.1 acyl-CoA dehydratase activase [Methylomusa anaerophila]